MAKEINVELNVNATQATKALDKFGGTLEDVYGEGVQPLNFAIGELEDRLYEMAAAGKSGTKEFTEMAREVGKMKQVIIDTDLAIDGFAMTTSQQVSGSLMGLTSGFEFAQGAMGAFGVESEKVEEALLKVQSAMALADGLQGLKEASKSFKALGASAFSAFDKMSKGAKIFAATGIGLLITAVALLVANFDKLKDMFSSVSAEQKALNATMDDYKKGAQDAISVTNDVEQAFQLAKDGVISKEEALKTYNEALGDSFGAATSLEEAEQNFIDKTDAYIEAAALRAQAQKLIEMAAEEQVKAMTAADEDQRSTATKTIDFIKSYYTLGLWDTTEESKKSAAEKVKIEANSASERLKILAASLQKEAKEVEKSSGVKSETEIDAAKAKEARDKEQEAKNKAAYEKRKALRDKELEEEKRRIEEERKAREELDKFKRDAENALADELEALDEEIYQAGLSAQEKELSALDTYYFEKLEKARQFGLDATALEEEYAAKTKEINDRYAAEAAAKEEEAREKQKEADEKALQDRLDREQKSVAMASSALDAINGLVQAFAGDNEKAQKRAFAIDKAVNIAKAVMNTATGVSQALASSPPPLSFINAGIAASVGAAQIATIAKTQFGGGASSSSASAPSVPSGGGARPATFNIVGNSGTNQLAETLGQPMKAYVVGSEVTTQQALDRNRVNNASI